MPAATDKSELMARMTRDFAKLRDLLDSIDADAAMAKGDDETSIKDIVAHRAHWIDLYLQWFSQAQTGGPVAIPAPGYKWSELRAYNRALRERQAGLGWMAARDALNTAHANLCAHLQQQDDKTLYGRPMVGNKGWTAGRYAEAAGPSHYRSAARSIRKMMRDMA